ncbi:DNA-binding response regulator [bacterium 1xD8-6]|jgi:Response regulators consisting of a CheY-like receiver domain and a winged-helix DNA-binding domain|nr:DNA-binding response regulator [bacterium D16-36]RKI68010.1 DNA-binding response regulator [bacterium 1xD8-6]
MAKILVVEDDRHINELIRRNLKLAGHECVCCFDGEQAAQKISESQYDLILLDVMLSGMSGFTLIEKVQGTPVIFVTAKGELKDKLLGLSLGAEDYIVKPFEMLELLARVNVILRRSQRDEDVRLGSVHVDLNKRTVEMNGHEVALTPQEYNLLEVFIRNKNIALSREKLLELAWGYDYEGETKTVDVHVQKLRKKLGLEHMIKTITKLGYRLEA